MKRSSQIIALALASLALVSIGSSAATSAEQTSADVLLEAARVSKEPFDTPGSQSEIERRALVHAEGYARREGDRLILGKEGGHQEVFKDNGCRPDLTAVACGILKLVVFDVDRDLAVLRLAWRNGGSGYVLIDLRTGLEFPFDDFPHISQSGNWVVGHSDMKVVAGDEPPAGPQVEVWRRVGFSKKPGATFLYTQNWAEAPFLPKDGKGTYRFDRWITEDRRSWDMEFEAHLEIDGKVARRFRVSNKSGDYVVTPLP